MRVAAKSFAVLSFPTSIYWLVMNSILSSFCLFIVAHLLITIMCVLLFGINNSTRSVTTQGNPIAPTVTGGSLHLRQLEFFPTGTSLPSPWLRFSSHCFCKVTQIFFPSPGLFAILGLAYASSTSKLTKSCPWTRCCFWGGDGLTLFIGPRSDHSLPM